MTAQEAKKLTGLEAREVVATNVCNTRVDPQIINLGDNVRFQLGRNIPHKVIVQDVTETGRTIDREINTTLFELIAHGPSFEAAVMMWRIKRLPSALRNDEKAKKALEALAA